MENITIITPARDASVYFDRFRKQFENISWPPQCLRLVVSTGDNADETLTLFGEWAAEDERVSVVEYNTGEQRYDSVVDSQRFRNLARVFNAAIDAVDLEWSDYVLMLPVDYRCERDLILRLIASKKDLIAAFSFDNDALFYDTWAFRHRGKYFLKFPREETSRVLALHPHRMETVGGVVLMRKEVLQSGVRYSEEDVDRGLCRAAQEKGFTVWADPSVQVYHL